MQAEEYNVSTEMTRLEQWTLSPSSIFSLPKHFKFDLKMEILATYIVARLTALLISKEDPLILHDSDNRSPKFSKGTSIDYLLH